MDDNLKHIQFNGVEVTLRRRTVLSDATAQAIITKLALFFVELAADLDEESEAVDAALTKYAYLSSQTKGAVVGVVLAKPSDSLETLLIKCRDWLVNTNPDTALVLIRGLDEVNATWNEPAMAVQLGDSADPK